MATEKPTLVKADTVESLAKLKVRKQDLWRFRGKNGGTVDPDPEGGGG